MARAVIPVVNADQSVIVQRSDGTYIQNADFSRTPNYITFEATAQIQPTSQGDIERLNGLNIQGVNCSAYLYGEVASINRPLALGGDLITTPDGTLYLVKAVLEQWPDWVKVALCLQLQP
jgi:hypothetical protein